MNRLGVHALVWEKGWSHAECERAIARTAEAGYDLIELPALDPDAIDAAFTRARLEQHGIGATASLGLDAETDISSGDPEKTKRGQARLEAAIAVAREIGATHVCGILYSAFQNMPCRQTPRAWPVPSRFCIGWPGRRPSRCAGATNVKVHLDVCHMNIEESDIPAAIPETGRDLGYFHTGDSHRGYMGSGSIDLAGVFRALVRADYQGPITFASFSSRVVGQPLEGILGIWPNLWEDGGDLAHHALLYTRAQLKAAHEATKQAERSRLI